jgi:mono/diheme cytochrome c family protein
MKPNKTMKYNLIFSLIIPFLGMVMLTSCGGSASDPSTAPPTAPASMLDKEVDPMTSIGIGPIKKIDLPAEIDTEMAAKGQEVYDLLCTACHKADQKFIGPAPAGILERRTPEWIMNMILNPEEMVTKDPIAKKLFLEYNASPMANQNLTEEQARQVLEYFRTL